MASPIPVSSTMDPTPAQQQFGQNQGIILSGSNLYTLLTDRVASTLNVWKSTDGGLTWAVKDLLHAPSFFSVSEIGVTGWCSDGTRIFAIYDDGTTVHVSIFTFSSDLWTSTTNTAVTAGTGIGTANSFYASAYRHSDNHVVIASQFSGASGGSSYFLFDATLLTSGSLIAIGPTSTVNQFPTVFAVVAVGSTNIWFCFYNDTPGNVQTIQIQLLGSATLTVVDTNSPPVTTTSLSAWSDGNVFVMSWLINTGSSVFTKVYQAPTVGLPAGFTVQNITTGAFPIHSNQVTRLNNATILISSADNQLTYWVDFGLGFTLLTILSTTYITNTGASGIQVGPTSAIGLSIITEQNGFNSTDFWLPINIASKPTKLKLDPQSLGVQLFNTGTAGALCRFGRPHRCKSGALVVMTGKDLIKWRRLPT